MVSNLSELWSGLLNPDLGVKQAQDPQHWVRVLWIRIILMRIRIWLITLTWIQILIFIWWRSGCGSGFFLNADADSTFHPNADPDPDPSFQIKAQTLEKVLMKWLIFHTFGLVTYKVDEDPDPDLMRMRIRMWMRIQVTKMMRIHPDPQHWYKL